MRAIRKRKLLFFLFVTIVLSLVTGLILYALRQNISLFYTPSQVIAGEAPLEHSIRVGGMVEKNSVRHKKGLEVEFVITDFNSSLKVSYQGILPDLFREGQGVIAQGMLRNARDFKAAQVLAKHDENYMPPEVKASLRKNT